MIERFNGRLSEVLATTRFNAAQRLEETLIRYGRRYNHHLPQRALGHLSSLQALQDWQEKGPERFRGCLATRFFKTVGYSMARRKLLVIDAAKSHIINIYQ